MAVAVTVVCAVLAFPMAFYMAKVASPRCRRILVVAVLTPLWASYLVKAYAWRAMLSGDGVVNWRSEPLGLQARASASPPRSSCWPTCGCRS